MQLALCHLALRTCPPFVPAPQSLRPLPPLPLPLPISPSVPLLPPAALDSPLPLPHPEVSTASLPLHLSLTFAPALAGSIQAAALGMKHGPCSAPQQQCRNGSTATGLVWGHAPCCSEDGTFQQQNKGKGWGVGKGRSSAGGRLVVAAGA